MWGGGVVEGSCGVCVVEQQFFNTSHVQEGGGGGSGLMWSKPQGKKVAQEKKVG